MDSYSQKNHIPLSFRCDTTEQQYHTAAQSLINLGLDSLGYQSVRSQRGALYGETIKAIRVVIAVGKAKVGIQAAVLLGTQPFFLQVFQLYLHSFMSSDSNLAFTLTGESISSSAYRIDVLKKSICRGWWWCIHSGVFACDFVGGTAHYIGSLDHENSDAASFASWGADYLKVWLS